MSAKTEALSCRILLVAALLLPATVFAQATTYSRAERDQFQYLRNQLLRAQANNEATEPLVVDLRGHLAEYPTTVNRKSGLILLFEHHAVNGGPCDTLQALADQILNMGPLHQDHFMVANAYFENECGLERAQDAVEEAIATMGEPIADRPSRYHRLLGHIHRDSNRNTEAQATYERALMLFDSGQGAGKISAASAARTEYRIVLGRDLARAYQKNDRLEKSLSLYAELYSERPKDEELESEFRAALASAGYSPAEVAIRKDEIWDELLRRLEHEVTSGKLDKDAEPFTLQTFQGDAVSLSDFAGKVTVLSFWAGWCAPCFTEFPLLVELKRMYPGDAFEILLINVDEDFSVTLNLPPDSTDLELDGLAKPQSVAFLNRETMMRQVADRFDFAFPMLLGGKETKDDYSVSVLPLTVVLDEEGRLQYRHEGFDEKSLIRERLEMEIGVLLGD